MYRAVIDRLLCLRCRTEHALPFNTKQRGEMHVRDLFCRAELGGFPSELRGFAAWCSAQCRSLQCDLEELVLPSRELTSGGGTDFVFMGPPCSCKAIQACELGIFILTAFLLGTGPACHSEVQATKFNQNTYNHRNLICFWACTV